MMHAGTRLFGGALESAVTDVDWAAVYAEHLPRLYNYFRFRTGDNAQAEDLAAQTFEQAWRGRARYRRDRGAFSTWLFAIARNIAASYFRRQQPTAQLTLDQLATQGDRDSLEELVQRRSDLMKLRRLLETLPPHSRELIELKYGAALTNREIARLTGLSESNVGTVLQRTVVRLRAAWDGREERDR